MAEAFTLATVNRILARAQHLADTGQRDHARLMLRQHVDRPGAPPALRAALGRLDSAARDLVSARRNLELALHQRPNAPGIQHYLADVLLQSGDWLGAHRLLQQVVQAQPNRRSAWVSLGDLELRLNNHAAVERVAEQLLRLAPNGSEAVRLRAMLALAQRQGALADRLLRAWLAVSPDNVEARGLLADLLSRSRRFEDAELLFSSALTRAPEDLTLATRYAQHMGRQGKFQDALTLFGDIARRAPQQSVHHANQGIAELWCGDFPAAIRSLQRAVDMEPSNASHQWNLSHALLQSGDFVAGFDVHEHRVAMVGAPPWWKDRWRGTPLPEGTPVVFDAAQGLGDGIQFVRFASDVAARGAKVVVRAHPRLLPLFSRVTGVAEVMPTSEEPPADVLRAKLLSLPHIVGVRSAADLGARVPYLSVEPERVDAWRARLKPDGLRVGIVWQGNPTYEYDHLRSPALRHFLPLSHVPSVTLYSLQKFHGTEQLDHVDLSVHPIIPFGQELDQDIPFLDTAATMKALDLVITSDTSTAHLAGGLGVPTWTVLPFAPDWRWPRTGSTTPWYPSMRMFRQPAPLDWPSVFREVEAALRTLATARLPSP